MSSIGTDIPYYNAPFTDFVDRGMVFLGSMQIYILLTNGRTSRKKIHGHGASNLQISSEIIAVHFVEWSTIYERGNYFLDVD